MPDLDFRPSREGFDEMRNMPALQRECLSVANSVAAQASHGVYDIETDVRPGRTRCHARASWSPYWGERALGGRYYSLARKDPADKALLDACKAHGGVRSTEARLARVREKAGQGRGEA